MRIAVLSDIHSAADHFREALRAAREEGFDQLVILGDLFTYGPDPVETFELAEEAARRDNALFITGNHDLLYFDGADGDAYAASLPGWIQECVEWTRQQLTVCGPLTALPWSEEWRHDRLLLSHANPFGPRDWTYVRDESVAVTALAALQDRGFDWGVFGHVHRFRRYLSDDGRKGVVTVGSVGQPRDKVEPFGQWAMVETNGDQVGIEPRRIASDWAPMIERIRATSLSDPTSQRLCRYYA